MSDDLFLLFATYGIPLLALTTFASCLALPVPSSLMMMTSGAFVASGDIDLKLAVASAFLGAVLGDQIGYQIGKTGRKRLDYLIHSFPRKAAILRKARRLLHRRGNAGVFLSRWLFSALGPYVNFAAGATGLGWVRFSIWGIAGEAVWVTLYTGIGYLFAENLSAAANLISNISGLLAGFALMAVTGSWLIHAVRARSKRENR